MTLDRAAPQAARRGTRPRNRRAQLIAAATDLLFRVGYDRIGMGDLADAVAIGPSALYRHFTGKQDMLRAVIAEGITPIRDLITGLDLRHRPTALPRLAALALDHRELGVLWQREARHMNPDDHAALRTELRDFGHILAERLRAARPELSAATADLLAWSTIAVLTSTSFHRLELPRPDYDHLLAHLVELVVTTPAPDTPPAEDSAPRSTEVAGGPGLVPRSRREALLAQAIRMFARQGYTGVGIEDIGAAVGITGASVYNHFSNKSDLLVAALRRGTAVLFTDLTHIYSTTGDPAEALNRLVRSYLRFTHRHHDLVDLMITEVGNLPESERHDTRHIQHDYVSEWVHLLTSAQPDLDPTTARIRVHAALSVANDAARTPHLRGDPASALPLHTVCTRVLLGSPTDNAIRLPSCAS
ncbi:MULTISPECIES: TetR/AcrR family transcriptional regulator [unclassified Crossiella]|uniref:TetR/AcrR family transcriptional regulator n=1 Tax=unclassified Crossiella TaxID=2620835 RepID=UPI001FFFEA9C|nr:MULTISPECIES: TetR/AcrR family transcriptional regulator [unclassified Crossiella]MCK2243747.1 TetR/AcrR family transcriptional regulator [Crossiella sp. S99.2]MCK2257606.1 TetR/AcrR family transcriptional regulator [Crossiella sp. S99.1]